MTTLDEIAAHDAKSSPYELEDYYLCYEHRRWLLARVMEAKAQFELIAAMSGMTLIGGADLEPNRAHELGANKAFEQAADIARAALSKLNDTAQEGEPK